MILCAVLFGLLIGSFLTVCIYRIPLSRLTEWLEPEEIEQNKDLIESSKNLSILSPARSFCPNCKKQLTWYQNIPLVSWLLQGGKSGCCKTPIPYRYPLIELMTGAAAGLSVYTAGLTITALFLFVFLCVLIIISWIDYDYYILPDLFNYPGTALGIVAAIINSFYPFLDPPFVQTWQDALLGAIIGGGGLYLVAVIYRWLRKKEGLGMGDVKYLYMVGAWFGLQGVFITLFVGSLLGTIGGLVGLCLMKREFNRPIPFGPYLAVATTLYVLGFFSCDKFSFFFCQ